MSDEQTAQEQLTPIEFSTEAQQYLAELLQKKKPEQVHVRVFIADAGTPKAETCIAYCPAGSEQEDDEPMQMQGFMVYVEQRSLPFLSEAKVDYAADTLGGQLTIKAPNARIPRVSDDSPLEDRVNYLLWNEINPMLASHGGQVSLVEIAEEEGAHVAVLQFGGGCQGCGMVDMTLKDGIEATMKEKIPQIAAVRDVTDHSMRENAWFKG